MVTQSVYLIDANKKNNGQDDSSTELIVIVSIITAGIVLMFAMAICAFLVVTNQRRAQESTLQEVPIAPVVGSYPAPPALIYPVSPHHVHAYVPDMAPPAFHGLGPPHVPPDLNHQWLSQEATYAQGALPVHPYAHSYPPVGVPPMYVDAMASGHPVVARGNQYVDVAALKCESMDLNTVRRELEGENLDQVTLDALLSRLAELERESVRKH